jgi:S-(hydroxymethyl)glutathione dehydrogenase/alcohol dehydrogenase
VTTFNRYAIVSENRLTVIPANSELQAAALFGCAVTTGFGTVDNKAKVRLGERVVVFGAGGIGLNIVQAAALAGASGVIAIDLFDNRLKLASHSGATETINSASRDAWARLAEIFATRGPDVFIENTGNPEVISRGYELVHSRGRVVLVGVPKKGANASVYTLPLHFGKELTGTTGGEAIPHEDIPRYLGLVTARSIKLNDLVTEVASLRNVNQLIQGMRDGSSAGRCLINFNL